MSSFKKLLIVLIIILLIEILLIALSYERTHKIVDSMNICTIAPSPQAVHWGDFHFFKTPL